MDLFAELNESQREAVEYIDGPNLVIAGAGSGKTRVLTYKIAYLLQQGVAANRVLALTFTNKAAREMKERIRQLVPESDSRYLWMGTFHSICARILRQEAHRLGYTRDFSIYDTTDSKSVLKQIIKSRQLDDKIYKTATVLSRISAAKNALISYEAYARNPEITERDRFERLYDMAELYREYDERLKAANAMDFDDLLRNLCVLFQTNSEVLRYYQDIFQYVLVDEYQDTNYVQFLLVRMLAEPENRITVVGDDAQSIYSFRGADIRNILSFQQVYPESRLFKLERNYRSTQTIVKAANSLIHHNENQIYKEVYSEQSVGDLIQLTSYATDKDEAAAVAALIRKKYSKRLDDVAILYRTNAQSRVFENELRKLALPYRIYGGTSFYQRKEIKDAIAYFRLAANPMDNEALQRIIDVPSRGIGDMTIRKIAQSAQTDDCGMLEVVAHPVEHSLHVSVTTMKRLKDFAKMMQLFTEAIETKNAYDFAELVLQQSGLMTAAIMDTTPEGRDRKANLDELLSGMHDFVDQRLQEGVDFTPIQDFLAEVSLLTDQDEHLEDRTQRVTLMTVHAAKGLEFAQVFVVGMEENLFPSQFCTKPSEIEEERRLLYVAITRAKEHAYLSFAKSRWRNGTVSFASPSRFLNDIDRSFVRLSSSSSGSGNASLPTSYHKADNDRVQIEGRTLNSLSSLGKSGAKSGTKEVVKTVVSEWKPEDRVQHRVFGTGTVKSVYVDGDNEKIDIQFDSVGKKTLLLTYAKLTRVEA
ncbi:MAG: UvrD-helicase domain-containing protein [Paludibacteraceae bacterium]|nr:UvrD-helicase domain-containing protein [Paludibacteraceae bacterium]